MKSYDHFKRTLQDYEVPIDKDRLWQKTSHAIPRRKKKRLAFWWLAGVAGVGLLTWLLSHTSMLSSTLSPESKEHIPSIEKRSIPADDTAIKSTDPSTTGVSPNSDDHTLTPSTSPKRIIRRPDLKMEPQHQQYRAGQTSNISSSEPTISTTSSDFSAPSKAHSTPFTPFHDGTPNLFVPSHKEQADSSKFVDDMYLTDAVSLAYEKKGITLRNDAETQTLPKIHIWPLSIADRKKQPADPIPSDQVKSHRPALCIGVAQGYGVSFLSVMPEGITESSVAAIYQDRLKGMEYSSTSLSGSIRWASGWTLGFGVQTRNWSTRLQYRWTQTERTQEEGTSTVIIDEQGQAQYFTDDIGVTTETEFQSTRFSQHRETALMLYASKTVLRMHRIRLDGYLQGQYNLHTSSSGTALHSDLTLFRYTPDRSPFSRSSPGSLEGGVLFQYHLHPGWFVTCRLGYTQAKFRQPIGTEHIQFRHQSLFLKLGTEYQL